MVHKVVPHGSWNDHKMEQMLRKVEKSPSNSTQGRPRVGHNNPQDCCNLIFCSFRFWPFSMLWQTCHGVLQNGNNECGGVSCNQKEHLFVVLVIYDFRSCVIPTFSSDLIFLCNACLSLIFVRSDKQQTWLNGGQLPSPLPAIHCRDIAVKRGNKISNPK